MQSNNHQLNWLHARGITDEVLSLFNVTTEFDHDVMGSCIRIPYSSTHAKYRRDPMDDRKPKYMYDSGGKVTLYGARLLPSNGHRAVVVTEGELDTLVLWSRNIPAVSSTGGAMSFQEEWVDDLKPYKVYLCFDNDDAGVKGMVKVLKMMPEASVILIPEIPGVKDISDYVAKGFEFRDLMDSALHDLSVESVKADMVKSKARMLSTRFHEAYLDAMQQDLHKNTYSASSYEGDDRLLKAKRYPIGNLMSFDRHMAKCPFHNEKTPSFKYYPKTNTCYCFGSCGRAYDAIDVYQHIHGCDFKTALEELNKKV